ncbi:hypothetical protein AFCA_011773 [Aspergillus flavus]|uniref:BTB domain-containing protein n=1 Tax=Aspergillus flavus TaxID=5059 RepID=A0AB74C634_ASPFL|nr:hypothetical protein COH20_011068 [Aspergillus flavus]RAQ79912.1 hypothetical protein COH21_011647 [Aspergillus flavus]RMZ41913.1 hypothetical protein CA14_011220 [Aspergillus flavus]UDD64538.1 hypothetical protein AFCA_011773 [Aspergillus flavus]
MHLDPVEETSYIDGEVREYPQPTTSPYKAPVVTLIIGRDEYIIPEFYLRQFPQLRRSPKAFEQGYNPSLKFVSSIDVDEDIGHTLVHYLYTGEYETLRDGPDPSIPRRTIEYRRSAFAYLAARKYGLGGLETHAKHYIEVFDRDVSTPDILRIARSIYSKLPRDETWFQDYIRVKMEDEFEADEAVFKREWFLNGIGRDASFDRLLVQIMAEIYSDKLATVNFRRLENGRQIVHSMANGDAVRISEETIPEEPEEEPAFEDVVPEVEPSHGYDGSTEDEGTGEYSGRRQQPESEPVSEDWPLTPSPPPSASSPHPTDETIAVDDQPSFPKPEPNSHTEPDEQPKDDGWGAWAPLRKRGKNKKKNKKLKIVEPEAESRAEPAPAERWPEVRHATSDESYGFGPPTPLSPVYEEEAPLPLRPASASLLEGPSY